MESINYLSSGIDGVSSDFSSIVSKTELVGVSSPLETIVNAKLQIIKKVATIAVALVIKFPAVLENIKFSCETPMPRAPPSDLCIKTSKTRIIASTMFKDNKIFSIDPFVSIDDGVADLVEIAVEKGKEQNKKLKLGICGEHGGDPKSIEFCSKVGLDYVSCSPYRVPIARLAAAQAKIKNNKR